jgi:hypothetical protein
MSSARTHLREVQGMYLTSCVLIEVTTTDDAGRVWP